MSNLPSTAAGRKPDLRFHPVANIFPILEGAEFAELVADIKAHGLVEPITMLDGMILDGRNRYRACIEAGVEPTFRPFTGDDPVSYVISANIRRRHLDAAQKRAAIATLLKTTPEKSNYAIAKQVKADDKTVASVRRELEGRSEIPNVSTRTDTKGRHQPARKGWSDERWKRHRARKRSKRADLHRKLREEQQDEASVLAEELAADQQSEAPPQYTAPAFIRNAPDPVASAFDIIMGMSCRQWQRLMYLLDINERLPVKGTEEGDAVLEAGRRQIEAIPPDDGLDIPEYLQRASS